MPSRQEAGRRHAVYFASLLRQTDTLWQQGNGYVLQALQLFDAEWPNIQLGQCWTQIEYVADEHVLKLYIVFTASGRNFGNELWLVYAKHNTIMLNTI